MSDHPQDPPPAPRPDGDAPLDDVPPVAGGTDDSPPAQGEGEHDSWGAGLSRRSGSPARR